MNNTGMLQIIIVTIGRCKNSACEELAASYYCRLNKLAKIKTVELAGGRFTSGQASVARYNDSVKMAKFLDHYPGAHVYLLTEFGQEFNSMEWADMLRQWDQNGQLVILVIGGAPGLDNNILKIKDTLSLSPLTWPHELARVLLLEQLYRGLTINAHKDYHY
ncbi:MAG TPA: 23S rRNA (pseudouridine(1915)-N(3))-methyltransferase RlmH [bacterium]|jgi:23S rRNA (pseudouridine1915-N3)-methyltransferase|nr:23S rRNA (pseudouridine(1915)-N(3))-methyltransferase RlmH [bacterium]HRS73091.1 23S rRNA (pseudouridine(1915)-N(3))-methyltransferase RlmH [Patescibacteria group bacterium]HOE81150.1 23S rRNA (pseudouridine(1915)-N(3))-methyltransferase RlmH [bacterium]HOR69507.1 23S rRNA (pseudouridine(1915)-N(3))-methyltransferase RlmH [bacterium]HOS99153.1 23S rRNA (pseudouridine(1915)-N(3))-methyltransferase RlmH [bacterium]